VDTEESYAVVLGEAGGEDEVVVSGKMSHRIQAAYNVFDMGLTSLILVNNSAPFVKSYDATDVSAETEELKMMLIEVHIIPPMMFEALQAKGQPRHLDFFNIQKS
tara:strand:+ start:9489 stop:9803 length:315 start_codon:yes stop_codon:yes gene_type:complete